MFSFVFWLLLHLAILPVIGTVYQLTENQCDGDPLTGAFGRMGKYERECALNRRLENMLGVEPEEFVFVIVPSKWEYSGFWRFYDRMGRSDKYRIDFQTGGCWSGDDVILIYFK